MQAQEADPEDLLLVDEMTDVSAAEAGARRAAAARVERRGIAREPCVPEVEAAFPRERAPRPRSARREHAVEHVDAACDHLDDALRVPDPHEIAGLVAG